MSLVMIARFEDPYEGEAAAGSLRADGIEVFFNNQGLASADPFSARLTGGFPLFVLAEDAAEARALLKGLIGRMPPPPERLGDDDDDTPEDLAARQAQRLRKRQIGLGIVFFGPLAVILLLSLFAR
jgi:hypothetical protein